MKLNSKIMLLVCIGLMMCVSAASACSPSISIDKKTNGADGLNIIVGTPITWTYDVTNTGDSPLSFVYVWDNKTGWITCPKTTLASGESMQCTYSGSAELGAYSNRGTVTSWYNGWFPHDCDESSYIGVPANPQIAIDKVTNGADGQDIIFGTPITWTYTVTNPGNVPLSDVTVTDDKGVVPVYQSGDTNGDDKLDTDETWIYTASGSAELGSYSNIGTATGSYGCEPVTSVTANDGSSYNGIVDPNSSSSVPEFPTVALPAAFIVGLVGVVLFIKGNKE